jgi:hypothetical protein
MDFRVSKTAQGVIGSSGAAEFLVDFLPVADLENYYYGAMYLVDNAVVADTQLAEAGEAAAQRLPESDGVQDEAVFYGFADAVPDVFGKAGDIAGYFGMISGLVDHYFQMFLWDTDFLAE